MKTKNGVTLIELLIAISLFSIIIIAATSMLVFGMKVNTYTINEFDLQSNLRVMSEKVNNTIRDSSAVFVMNRDNSNNLSEGWNYLMLNDTKTQIVEYYWDDATKSHKQRFLSSIIDGAVMEFSFAKKTPANADNLLEFVLDMKQNGVSRSITTQVESINSLQVIDRAYGKVANVLAYRQESRLKEVSTSQAAVSFVMDTSGSMAWDLNGYTTNNAPLSRIYKMKAEASRLITELSKQNSIYVSINPFSSSGNMTSEMVNAQVNNVTNTGLLNAVNNLYANGGTNTGDGIRRGFYQIKSFNEKTENLNKTNKNFMIILVDGVTTFGSIHNFDVITRTEKYNTITLNENTPDEKIYVYYDYIKKGNKYTYYYKGANFVVGDGNIENREGNDTTDYSIGRYYGNGSDLDYWGTKYVEKIGQMVMDYKKQTPEAIKVYVIGFSANSNDYVSLRDIALDTSGDSTYYTAGSSEALQEILSSIQRDISDALWHIGGPN